MTTRTQDDHPLGYGVVRLERALVAALDQGLRRHGLTTSRYGVLTFMDMEPGLTSAELARRAFVTPQTMMRLVKGLEADGLISRDEDENPGRAVALRLTQKGKKRLAAAHTWVIQVEQALIDGESERSLTQTSRFLARATSRMQAISLTRD